MHTNKLSIRYNISIIFLLYLMDSKLSNVFIGLVLQDTLFGSTASYLPFALHTSTPPACFSLAIGVDSVQLGPQIGLAYASPLS